MEGNTVLCFGESVKIPKVEIVASGATVDKIGESGAIDAVILDGQDESSLNPIASDGMAVCAERLGDLRASPSLLGMIELVNRDHSWRLVG
jgi:hypothetical protein